MTPYRSFHLDQLFRRRRGRMPTAMLKRVFGQPDLVSKALPNSEWYYVVKQHFFIGHPLPINDIAHVIQIRHNAAYYVSWNRLSLMFYEKYSNKSIKYWRLLRPWTAV
jgi:hypothetical protein